MSRPTQNINAYRKNQQNYKHRNTVPQSGIAPSKVHAAEFIAAESSTLGGCAKAVPALMFPDSLNIWAMSDKLFVGSLMLNGMRTHSTVEYWKMYSAPGSPQIKTKFHVPL